MSFQVRAWKNEDLSPVTAVFDRLRDAEAKCDEWKKTHDMAYIFDQTIPGRSGILIRRNGKTIRAKA